MMHPLWLANLASYCVQVAALVAAGGLAAALLRLRQPRVMLVYWQALLAACLLLPFIQPWHQMALAPAGGVTATVLTSPVVVRSPAFLFPLQTWILLMLVAGGVLGLLRLALGLFRLNHYRRTALRIAPLPGALREAQALVGVEPTFYLSQRVSVPVTFGWLDPAVVLPAPFEQMDESYQRAIACHELLHVARRDWLLNLLEELVLTVFWFHPAIWWTIRTIRLDREHVVDGEVVALTGARKPYLYALLEIAGAARAMPVPAPLFLLESQLARRVALLVKDVRVSKSRLIASLVIASAVLLVAGWLAIRTFRLTAPTGIPPAVNSAAAGPAEPAAPPHPATKNDTAQVYKVGGGVAAPVPIYKPEPPYTKEARAAKLQDTVILSVVVDASGSVTDVRRVKGGAKGLDESAVQTVHTWKFKPATRYGKPVPVKVKVEVAFRLF
jgi:TonB family protein